MMMDDLWGVPPDTQGLYGQDFFYGAWLDDPVGLLDADTTQKEIDTLSSLTSRTKKQNESLESAIKRLEKRRVAFDTRNQWPDWLFEAPSGARCQWCARHTRLWVRSSPNSTIPIAPSKDFVDINQWRRPHDGVSGFCPSCGLMILSAPMGTKQFGGVKAAAKIVRLDDLTYRVVSIGGNLPWWLWPVAQTPALWTHLGKQTSRYAKLYWVHLAEPTWSSHSVTLWTPDRLWRIPGEGLRFIQEDARSQAHQIELMIKAGEPTKSIAAFSKEFSSKAADRWRQCLGMSSSDRSDLVGSILWIPSHSNVAKSLSTVGDLLPLTN